MVLLIWLPELGVGSELGRKPGYPVRYPIYHPELDIQGFHAGNQLSSRASYSSDQSSMSLMGQLLSGTKAAMPPVGTRPEPRDRPRLVQQVRRGCPRGSHDQGLLTTGCAQ